MGNESWLCFKTNLTCPDCNSLLYFRKPKGYTYKEDKEPLFLDSLFCQNCQKTFHYIDAFFYDLPKNKEDKIICG
jgi:uncharacterized protein YbaR (Trm112 family)